MESKDPSPDQVKAEMKPVTVTSESTSSKISELVKPLNPQGGATMKKKVVFSLVVVLVVLAGIGTGYALSLSKNAGFLKDQGLKREVSKEEIGKGTKVGVADEKTFKDSAEGQLEKGGADGEGSHHLVRPGGESQNVYLTSSIIDLDQFVGRKVKVWGETFAAQKAGWLMDVGKLEVLE